MNTKHLLVLIGTLILDCNAIAAQPPAPAPTASMPLSPMPTPKPVSEELHQTPAQMNFDPSPLSDGMFLADVPVSTLSPKEQLESLLVLEKQLKLLNQSVESKMYRCSIALEEAILANDTTPALAHMLSSMRRDMHAFSAPFFQEVVAARMRRVQTKQVMLMNKIKDLGGETSFLSMPADQVPSPEAAGKARITSKAMEDMDIVLSANMPLLTPENSTLPTKKRLEILLKFEEQLRAMNASMQGPAYREKVHAEQQVLANETTPGLAMMLTDMRLDMHALAAPYFREVLEKEIEQVRNRQVQLMGHIVDDKKNDSEGFSFLSMDPLHSSTPSSFGFGFSFFLIVSCIALGVY